MKNVLFLMIVTLSLISFSCEEDFEPKTNFTERYVLNAVFNADSLQQLVSLSRSYDVDGFDPYTNDVDPYIKNALIYIKHRGTTYQMFDTSITRTDTSRYKGPLNIYSIRSFVPAANDSIEIIAIPKEGVTISAMTKIPSKLNIVVSKGSVVQEKTPLTFSWPARDLDIYYLPRLKIYYSKRNEAPGNVHSVEVPIFIDEKGHRTYAQITKSPNIYYGDEMIDKTMEKLSEGDEKINFQFNKIELEVKIFDEFLSNYISSTNIFYDDISIRLDEPNYTNVNGGLGVVGSTHKSYKAVSLTADYLLTMGFTP